MPKKWLYCVQNMGSMKIEIDNRETNSMYVDNVNLHKASDDEIIKMVNRFDICNLDTIALISKIIVVSTNIPLGTADLLYSIYTTDSTDKVAIYNNYKYDFEKSRTTFERYIIELKIKNIIKVTTNDIIICDKYKINKDIDKAKFLVIELNAKDTSKGIDI